MVDEQFIYSNGIFAETGEYGAVIDLNDLYEGILSEREAADPQERNFLRSQEHKRKSKTLGPPPSINPMNLSEARWGIILPPNPLTENEQLHYQALGDLIARRRQQMGGKDPHIFNYQSNWGYDDFLWSEGREVEPGNMQPEIVPYYLCIVGSPERISWEFQQYLDSEYAVGRLWFDDPEDCSRYIEHLMGYEKNAKPESNSQEVLFVGTQHENDRPTQSSANQLIEPLYHWLIDNSKLHFKPSLLLGNQPEQKASKANFLTRLKGIGLDGQPKSCPSLIFTASHGLEHKKSSDIQYETQGALLCQDWPGGLVTPLPSDYISARDITEEIDLAGIVAFCFACYSAGTPIKQDWVYPTFFQKPATVAKRSFVASLPQKMLANGLLAFIGHVSKTWDYSFLGINGTSQQLGILRETVGEILVGKCIGHATNYLNDRWSRLTTLLDKRVTDKSSKYSKEDIVSTWIARNDCRGYVVLGDPAAKLVLD